MKTLTLAIALLVCLAPVAQAQHPIFIINGVRLDKCENTLTTTGANPLSLADLNPNAIENIEVIKGPAAASLYGPDGANGVITVTMKKGARVSPTLCSTPTTPCPVYVVDGKEVGLAACEGSSPPKPAADPIARYLYAPELVMAHQEAIGLTDRQRTGIQGIIKDMQSQVVDVQLKLASSSEKLTRLLSAPAVDEAAVLRQIDQVLASEREVKRAQISLLVRIKNQLTAAQQAMLDKVR
jgi:TonB-dependent SusC/RagA subfamily outer membrane receptor